MPAVEPAAAVQADRIVFVIGANLPAEPNCATALQASYWVDGLSNGEWVSVLSGTAAGFASVNDCGFQKVVQLPLPQAQAYSAFRLVASATLSESVVTRVPVGLTIQQDPYI